jgi:hypothetical protein
VNPGEGYRLLEPGEAIVDGDEFFSASGTWKPSMFPNAKVVGAYGIHGHIYRRKLPAVQPIGWVSVKERLPASFNWYQVAIPQCCFANAYLESGKWIRGTAGMELWNHYEYDKAITHWREIGPNPPAPPKSDAEIAWEKYREFPTTQERFATGEDHIKAAFIAGFNAEATK